MRFFYPQAVVRVTLTANRSFVDNDQATETFMAVPRECVIERNSYNEADTCKLDFDFQSIGVMPRLFSQVLVQVYAGDGLTIDSLHNDIVADRYLSFIGYGDEPEAGFDDGDDKIGFTARDYTALFLGAKRANPAIGPSYSENLYDALRRITNAVPGGENIKIRLDGMSTWPSLSLGAPKGMAAAKVPMKTEASLWDFVKAACDPVNLIPQIKLDTLVIAPSRGLIAPKSRALFVYGENLSDYKEKKNLDRIREGIGLKAWDASAHKYITAIYPAAGDRSIVKSLKKALKKNTKKPKAPEPTPGASDKRQWLNHRDVSGPGELAEAAERIYTQRRLQEFGGSFKCDSMVVPDYGGDRSVESFDVTQLANGERIVLDIDKKTRTMLAGFPTHEARAQALVDLGYERGAADLMAELFESHQMRPLEVYTDKACHKYNDDGYELSVDFKNIIEGDSGDASDKAKPKLPEAP